MALTEASGGEFWFARACFIFAAADLLGLSVWYLWPEVGEFRWWRLFVGLIAGAILVPSLIFSLYWVDLRESGASTRLFPANDPDPPVPSQCEIPKGALKVFLGSSVAWATRMPHTVLMMGSERMLAIDENKNRQSVTISTLRIFDDRADIIARISNASFWVRDDTHKVKTRNSLVVFDHNDHEVLNVRMLNGNSILITGSFRQRSIGFPVLIGQDAILMGGATMSRACLGEAGLADIAVGGLPFN